MLPPFGMSPCCHRVKTATKCCSGSGRQLARAAAHRGARHLSQPALVHWCRRCNDRLSATLPLPHAVMRPRNSPSGSGRLSMPALVRRCFSAAARGLGLWLPSPSSCPHLLPPPPRATYSLLRAAGVAPAVPTAGPPRPDRWAPAQPRYPPPAGHPPTFPAQRHPALLLLEALRLLPLPPRPCGCLPLLRQLPLHLQHPGLLCGQGVNGALLGRAGDPRRDASGGTRGRSAASISSARAQEPPEPTPSHPTPAAVPAPVRCSPRASVLHCQLIRASQGWLDSCLGRQGTRDGIGIDDQEPVSPG